mgnify:CR=1 FL=1
MLSRSFDRYPALRRPAAALIAGLLTVIALTGCGVRGSRPAPVSKDRIRPAEVHFTSPTGTLTVYLTDDPVVIQTGGVTQTPYYDAKGNVLGYINYGRVDYVRWLPATPTPAP